MLQYSGKIDENFTDIMEIKVFIGFCYLTSVQQSNKQILEEFRGDDGYRVEMFRLIMNLKWFKFLNCFSFDDFVT